MPNLDRHVVTAVLVAHEGAHWLPETLKALLTQTRPVDRLVAADTGSRDACPALLTEVVGEGNLLKLPPDTGYAEAVRRALDHPAAELAVPAPDAVVPGGRTEWIWLLHDDSVPAPDALEHLLITAETQPPAVIVGPKVRDWEDRRVLLEAGVAIGRSGRRETGLDRLEFDQGQHDVVREVMAVGTAGLLIRRDVWHELGGLGTEFGLFRDDVDLGWRAYARGHRVLLAPGAVLFHAEAAARGLRAGPVPASDRRNALLVLFANLPLPALGLSMPVNALGSLLRALVLLLVGRRLDSRAELAALGDVLGHPRRLYRMRRVRVRGYGHSNVGRFQPRLPALRRLPDLLTRARWPTIDGRTLRSRLRRPSVVVVLALSTVALLAERDLILTGGRLGGGAMVAPWGGASDLWAQYLAGWHPAGLGSGAGSPPYVGVLAILSTLFLGKPWLAVMVLLLGSVPLAGLTAYAAARTVLRTRPAVAAWAAVTYALLPVATGAIATGRLGTAVVIVLLPLIGRSAHRILAEPARHAAWTTALLLTVAMAFAPLTWVLIAIVGLLAGYSLGADLPHVRRRVAIALIVPPFLVFPWTLGLLGHPSRLLREAGLHHPAAPMSPDELIMLGPGGPGVPAGWVTGGLLLTGLAALLLPRRRTAVLAGWLAALSGLLVAILVTAASAWPGIALTFAAAGLVLAASGVVRSAVEVLNGRGAVRRAGAFLVVAVAAATPLLAAGSWVARGADGPYGRTAANPIPAGMEAGPGRSRILVLGQRPGAPAPGSAQPAELAGPLRDPGGEVAYTLLRGRPPVLGEEAVPPPEAALQRLREEVAKLAGGVGDGAALARFGVRYLLVPRPYGGSLARPLDGTPGLTALSRSTGFALWRIDAPAGRLMLLDHGRGTVLASAEVGARVRIPAGAPGRTVLLAEPADGGWHATLGGRSLRSRTVGGWAQAYDVPPGGGEFELRRGMRLRHLWVCAQGLMLVLAGVLALPYARSARGRRRRPRGRRAAPRAVDLPRLAPAEPAPAKESS